MIKKIILISMLTLVSFNNTHAAENVTVSIAESLDDVWEGDDGFVYNAGRLDTEGVVGLRFAGVSIPTRSIIVDAHIEMTFIDSGGGDFFENWIWVAADTNPTQFVQVDYDVTTRQRIQLAIPWNVPFDEYALWQFQETKQTPSLTDLVQKVVNRTGWNETIMFFITPQRSDAVFASFNHPFYEEPKLMVEYIPRQIYTVDLPSGATGDVEMTATAGDTLVAGVVGVLLAVAVFQELRSVAHRSAR